MISTYFFKIEEMAENAQKPLFEEFENQKIFFSYFEISQQYYIFCYAKNPIKIDCLYHYGDILEELNVKQRRLRSARGFLLYALEIMGGNRNFNILATNLPAYFWPRVDLIIRQNKPGLLERFLFSFEESSSEERVDIQSTIQEIQNQIVSLQEKILQLESQNIKIVETKKTKRKVSLDKQFKKVGNIPEEELKEIIQTGFQLIGSMSISLRDYYESKEENSLYQQKGYCIKYETIRHNKFYRQLKNSNI